MFKWISKEIKISLKSKKNLILFLFVIVSIFAFISNEKLERNLDQSTLDKLLGNVEYNENSLIGPCSPNAVGQGDFCDYLKHETKYAKLHLDAFLTEDVDLYHKLSFTFASKYLYDQIDYLETYFDNNKSIISEAKQLRILESKKILSENRIYYIEDYDNNGLLNKPAFQLNLNDFYTGTVRAEYVANMIGKNFGIIEKHDITPITFIVNYLNTFGLFLILIVFLINFDMVSRDFSSGVIKSFFSTQKGRNKYFVVKIVSSFLVTAILILGPIVITTLLLTISSSPTIFSHPALLYKEGINTFNEIIPYSESAAGELADFVSDYRTIVDYGPISNVLFNLSNSFSLTFLLSVSTAWTVIKLSLILFLLFIIFSILFSYCIGVLTNNNNLTLILSVLTLAVGIVISSITKGSLVYKLNPFTYVNVVRVIEGTIPSSFLYGEVVLLGCILFLILFGYVITKRKNVYI